MTLYSLKDIIKIVGVNSFTIYDARLNGSSVYQGAVEVLTDHGWLPVCERHTSTWDYREVGVICRQLGYTTNYYSEKVSNKILASYPGPTVFQCYTL